MLNKNRIIQEISVLYELALAVGNSVDARENCQQFLNTLTRRKGLAFASVWVKDNVFYRDEDKREDLRLLYGAPISRMKEQFLDSEHGIIRLIGDNDFLIIDDTHPSYSLVIQEKNVTKGVYAIFRLGNFGILKLFRPASSIPFQQKELSQLRSVVNKFTVSLEGCLAFEKLQIETQEREKVEQKLRKSNDRYFDLFENMYDVLLTIDDKGKITQSNRAGRELLGINQDETEPVYLKELVHPEDAERSKSFLKKLVEEGYYSDYEGRIITKDGETKYVQVNSTAIYKDGEFVGSRDMVRDITTRKEAELALIRAKKVAEQARLAEQQFLANMSHEIRTPMNAVIGMTHLLGGTQLNNDQQEYLESLQFSANHLMGLINNILDLSKIEAGELVFESKEFDLLEQLQMLRRTYQLKLEETGVSVQFELDDKIPQKLIGDSLRLNQILTNLLGNASKFTHEGHIGIQTKLIREENDLLWLNFTVFDTGIGIEEDKLQYIFENFKQADLQVTRKYGGSGLGLSIVKQLVQIQGGQIEVQSEVGKGTYFSVLLPFKNAIMIEKEDPCEQGVETIDMDEVLKGTQVLVVEDNLMNQRLIKRILTKWECEFEIANNGLEGVKKANQKSYDVILMDIHMPEMDGVEATRQIRSQEGSKNQKTPIIALTAAALLEEKNRVLEAGMDDFMVKPFVPKHLKTTIFKYLEGCNEPKEVVKTSENNDFPLKEIDKMLDLSYLREISGGDEEFMVDMMETFLAEAPQNLNELNTFFSDQNFIQLAKTAHRIKPNLSMMGMPQLEDIAKRLEKGIKANELQDSEIESLNNQLVQGLESKLSLLQQAVDNLKQGL